MQDNTTDYRRRVRLAREGRSALSEDEQDAQEVIDRLGKRFLEGHTSAAEERKLRNAMALVRRSSKISEQELRLRARRGWIR